MTGVEEPNFLGISMKQWEAAFRPGMNEFAASNFVIAAEADGAIRIAFGNSGPYINDQGSRTPVYNSSVTISANLAIELARLILKFYARPDNDPPLALSSN